MVWEQSFADRSLMIITQGVLIFSRTSISFRVTQAQAILAQSGKEFANTNNLL